VFKNLRLKIGIPQRGITLIEVIVVVFIIGIFSSILISNFPEIQRQFALSRATYKLAQNLRKVQDMGLSGVKITDETGQTILLKGYGIYIDATEPAQQYIIYGDSCLPTDYKYTFSGLCQDHIFETINVNEDNAGVVISTINNIDSGWVSINFSPPNPYLVMDTLSNNQNNIEIVLALSNYPSVTSRAVSINKSGLIEVK